MRSNSAVRDAWTRALPLLVIAYLLLGLNALDVRNWSLGRNLAGAAAVIAMLLAAFVALYVWAAYDLNPFDNWEDAYD